jgi:hypothetical protein
LGEALTMEVGERRRRTVQKNETFVLSGTKMKYISAAAGSVVFDGVD